MTKTKIPENDDFDLRNFLPFLLNQAAEQSSLEFQQIYKNRYGMLRTEWRVLFHLGTHGEMTAKQIGERALIHKTKVSRAVAKLAQRRYLTRTRDEADRRSEQLALTAAGQAVYRELRGIAERYDERMAAHFTKGEAALLRMMLRRLAGMD
ncbi:MULTISPECIES: MarR family winged helix-turn-helix transcriptional regulator [Ruegeria]|uniref:MarR family transcriptional regulator n=3 Tax=Ruegeria TaxID=97050 RepID=A0A6B2NQT6_9RHOB|nr:MULTISPECIES: MarR family transcriptional regulator [unclassified Ruegeria]MCU9836527.1 MarR family transcriptional regulator [Ruegeria sp. WL0004]MCV2890974.1 MarR family transcriptional regulator [Ruegeria sp. XHP0148]NDW45758.1 MarR family transcriptional regulator [Ruegeria sp. PrR005]